MSGGRGGWVVVVLVVSVMVLCGVGVWCGGCKESVGLVGSVV